MNKIILLKLLILLILTISTVSSIISLTKDTSPPPSPPPSPTPPTPPPPSQPHKFKLLIGQSLIRGLKDYHNLFKGTSSGGSCYWYVTNKNGFSFLRGVNGDGCATRQDIMVTDKLGSEYEAGTCENSGAAECGSIHSVSTDELNPIDSSYGGLKLSQYYTKSIMPTIYKPIKKTMDLNNESFYYTKFLNDHTDTYGDTIQIAIDIGKEIPIPINSPTPQEMRNFRYAFLEAINNKEYDNNFQAMQNVINLNSNLTFLVRIGYEVQFQYFVPDEFPHEKLRGINNPKNWVKARTQFKMAFNRIANFVKSKKFVKNYKGITPNPNPPKIILHLGQETTNTWESLVDISTVNGIIDKLKLTKGIKFLSNGPVVYSNLEAFMGDETNNISSPEMEIVDMIGFSIFSIAWTNDNSQLCECPPTKCPTKINDSTLSHSLELSDKYYQKKNKHVGKKDVYFQRIICESGLMPPWSGCVKKKDEHRSPTYSIFYKNMIAVINKYKFDYWVYIVSAMWFCSIGIDKSLLYIKDGDETQTLWRDTVIPNIIKPK